MAVYSVEWGRVCRGFGNVLFDVISLAALGTLKRFPAQGAGVRCWTSSLRLVPAQSNSRHMNDTEGSYIQSTEKRPEHGILSFHSLLQPRDMNFHQVTSWKYEKYVRREVNYFIYFSEFYDVIYNPKYLALNARVRVTEGCRKQQLSPNLMYYHIFM
jgi:hypothetical protein